MSKKAKKNKRGIADVALVCFGIIAISLAGFNIAKAQEAKSNIAEITDLVVACEGDQGCYDVANNALRAVSESLDMELGAQPGTTITMDRWIYGSEISKRLTFKEGATSTSGLVYITNYGPAKVCDKVELDL